MMAMTKGRRPQFLLCIRNLFPQGMEPLILQKNGIYKLLMRRGSNCIDSPRSNGEGESTRTLEYRVPSPPDSALTIPPGQALHEVLQRRRVGIGGVAGRGAGNSRRGHRPPVRESRLQDLAARGGERTVRTMANIIQVRYIFCRNPGNLSHT